MNCSDAISIHWDGCKLSQEARKMIDKKNATEPPSAAPMVAAMTLLFIPRPPIQQRPKRR
jgi:hypothetical protein